MTSAAVKRDRSELERLIQAQCPSIHIPTLEEEYVGQLIRQIAVDHRLPVFTWDCANGIRETRPGQEPLSRNDTYAPTIALAYFLKNPTIRGITVLIDVCVYLKDPQNLRVMRELIAAHKDCRSSVIILDHHDPLPTVIAHSTQRAVVTPPDDEELIEIIRTTLRQQNKLEKVSGTVPGRVLNAMVRNLRGLSRVQAATVILEAILDDRKLAQDDLNQLIASKRRILHSDGLLEYVESPVSMEAVAGMPHLKEWLRRRKGAFRSKARDFGLTAPRGVLIVGIPGAGKSFCAKAIATAWERPLLRLDPAVLYNKYIGESERQLRVALDQAEAMSPAVLWIDEIEKGFVSTGGDPGGTGPSRRMFGTMLTWMQEHQSSVFTVATANQVEELPAELMRKGRFDEIVFVDLPTDADRRALFEIHLRLKDRDPKTFDCERLSTLSDGYTGAEIEQAILSALHTSFDNQAALTTEAIAEALIASPPLSVTKSEYVQYLRDWASDRCMKA